jgi:hypothetical protein
MWTLTDVGRERLDTYLENGWTPTSSQATSMLVVVIAVLRSSG